MGERFDAVFGEVCREHGLTSSTDLVIGRLLVEEMLAPEPNGDRILRLRGALPPRVVAEPEAAEAALQPDLGRLTDSQLEQYRQLTEIIYDQAIEPFRDMTPPRYDAAYDLVAFVETRVEQKGTSRDRPLDYEERAVLLGRVGAVIGDLVLLPDLCREHWGSYAGLPREGEASEEAPSAEETTAPADMSNVRRLDNLPGSAGLRSRRPLPPLN